MWPKWARVAVLVVLVVVACVYGSAQLAMFTSYSMSTSLDPQGACFNTQNGFTTPHVIAIRYFLKSMKTDFKIAIPEYQGCNKVGVVVSVCEAGGASTGVQLAGLAKIYVRRSGDLRAPVWLHTRIYCA